jgi:hypothetical protein
MAEVQVKPRWTDLIGIDPDYTDGRPVDEWLEARHDFVKNLTDAERRISWAGLMELLDEHWPADLFPTLEDDPTRDAGARIVSLLRWVDRLQAQPPTWRMASALGRLPYRDNPDNRPRMDETATQFLARMFEQTKCAPITYPTPDSLEFGAMAAIKRFIARGRYKR